MPIPLAAFASVVLEVERSIAWSLLDTLDNWLEFAAPGQIVVPGSVRSCAAAQGLVKDY